MQKGVLAISVKFFEKIVFIKKVIDSLRIDDLLVINKDHA